MSFGELLGNSELKNDSINGVVIGIVTNNKDPESMGRVKLKFPWRGSEDESNWARVASLMAGKGMGSFFLPEVGDEVLVAFGEGDINDPYVIGSLWNGKEAPPKTNSDGKNNIRMIKSRSGHTLLFDDNSEQSKEMLVLKTKGGQAITLDDSAGTEKIEIKDKNDNMISTGPEKIEVKDKNGNIISIGAQKIEIQDKSGNKICMDSTQNNITIEAKLGIKLKGTMIDIESSANMTLKSSGIMTIQGSLVKIN